jgi:hypothetical protein
VRGLLASISHPTFNFRSTNVSPSGKAIKPLTQSMAFIGVDAVADWSPAAVFGVRDRCPISSRTPPSISAPPTARPPPERPSGQIFGAKQQTSRAAHATNGGGYRCWFGSCFCSGGIQRGARLTPIPSHPTHFFRGLSSTPLAASDQIFGAKQQATRRASMRPTGTSA